MNREIAQRINGLRIRLRREAINAMVVLDRTNTLYLTGFKSSYSILIVDSSEAVFITDSRYAEMAESALDGFRIEVQPSTGVVDFLAKFFKHRNYDTAGYEGTITVNELAGLKKWTRGTRLVEAGGLIGELRRVKSDHELRLIRKAVSLGDKLLERIYGQLRHGMTELEVSRLVRFGSEEIGAEGESFENIVASGPNSSRPHHHPGKRKLKKGDVLTIDSGVRHAGYCSDLTRNFTIGKVPPKIEEIHAVCVAANQAAIKAVRPGMTGPQVDAVARKVIEDAGYGKYFGHGLGHGVGLEIHEAPRLSPSGGDYKLEAGNIVTIEPGIYIPGLGGVRVEDYVVLTPRGCQVLSRVPRTLRPIPA